MPPECHCCPRYVARATDYLDLNDNGRYLCSKCYSIAIMDPKECKPLFQKVLKFYRNLGLEVDEDIPYFLVDSATLHKFFPEESVGTIGGGYWVTNDSSDFIRFERIKNCLKGKGKIIVQRKMEVLKRPKKPGFMTFKRIKRCMKGTGKVKEAKTPFAVVLVLFGRPNVDIGATLAHEMMHAWLHSYDLEERVEEGICQVIEYLWLEWFCPHGFDSSCKTSVEAEHTKDLKNYKAHEIECCQEFRDAMNAVTKSGFTSTLDHLLKEGSLPC